jgi:hypothetical protein
VPEDAQCVRSLALDSGNWYGGWGIALSGSNNQILNNRIVGLHRVQTANETPPIAIEIFGTGHEVSGNIIGVDSADKEVGVCGQGIKVSGNNTQIVDNQVIGSRAGFEDDAQTAMMASDTSPTFGQITVRRNIVKDGPGNVYAFGPGIPQLLQIFAPAKISSFNGTTVMGTAGDGSPCPGCLIDFYLDDGDAIGEALVHLGSVTATADGNFSFDLPQPLTEGMGIRTSSTAQDAGIIGSYGSGTTTRISKLYLPMSAISITAPMSGEVGIPYTVTISVGPAGTTAPFDYMVTATDKAPQMLNGTHSPVIEGSFTWTEPGVKSITATVENELGTITESRQITITDPMTNPDPDPDPGPETKESNIYMPKLKK